MQLPLQSVVEDLWHRLGRTICSATEVFCHARHSGHSATPHSKTAALHLHQLVNQHIAMRANITSKTSTAQDKSLTKSATIGELGKVQIDALHSVQANRMRVSVVS
jgi:hypothetical protein